MEGKTVILGALIMSLVLAQFQVDAKSCCPSTSARNIYNVCRLGGGSRALCAKFSGCIIQSSSSCAPPNNHDILENSGDVMKSYCKMGCASSACNANAYGEVANEALEQCIDACSEFCTKGSIRALEIEVA